MQVVGVVPGKKIVVKYIFLSQLLYCQRDCDSAAYTAVNNINRQNIHNVMYIQPCAALSEAGKTQIILLSSEATGKYCFSGKLPAGKHDLLLTDKINNLPAGILFIKTEIKDRGRVGKDQGPIIFKRMIWQKEYN